MTNTDPQWLGQCWNPLNQSQQQILPLSPIFGSAVDNTIALQSNAFSWQGLYDSRTSGGRVNYAGSKPLVVCNGTATECKDLEDAQSKAEALAHQHGADAYVLKPVKKVAPKRDVVTTDL